MLENPNGGMYLRYYDFSEYKVIKTTIIVGPNTDLSLTGAVGFTGKIEYLTSKKLSQQVAGTKHVYRNQAKRQARKYYHATNRARSGR